MVVGDRTIELAIKYVRDALGFDRVIAEPDGLRPSVGTEDRQTLCEVASNLHLHGVVGGLAHVGEDVIDARELGKGSEGLEVGSDKARERGRNRTRSVPGTG